MTEIGDSAAGDLILQGDTPVTNTTQLAVTGEVNAAGAFEVMAITAGEGNGWQFSEQALRDSLALWDGAECFVDHAWYSRSLRDLAGVLHSPEWDETRKGIKCQLRAVGPSAALLSELGKEMLKDGAEKQPGKKSVLPRIGFSADVMFTSQGRKVEKILRVLSVDLVFNPARGGAFLRAINSVMPGGVFSMPDVVNTNEQPAAAQQNQTAQPVSNPTGSSSVVAQLQRDAESIRSFLDVQAEQQRLQAEAEAARQVRAEMCSYLVESALAAAKLPGPVNERVRKQFAGKVFEPGELTQAIEDARKMVSELTGSAIVQGPGRVHGMFNSVDQITAAIHDLMEVGRPDELRDVRPARLSGIRELYTIMTGDTDFIGGYNPERAQFATTVDLPSVLKNAMNKLIVDEWQELGRSGYRWWEPVVSMERFSNLQQITGVLVGEVTVLPTVAEGAAYTSLNVTDSSEVGTWSKYGGYIGLTLEMFERDETHKLRQYPRKLASAGLRRISALVGSVFTANAGVGPNMADGTAVFAAGRGNLGATVLSSTAWEAASAAIYNQNMLVPAGGTAPKLALDAKYLIVPRSLRLTARQILYPSWERENSIFSENMQKGEMGDVITCPEFSDADDWAAVGDPRLAPGIILGHRFGVMPEIIVADGPRNGALFTNDEIRMKARHWLAVFVADYRPLYKANVI